MRRGIKRSHGGLSYSSVLRIEGELGSKIVRGRVLPNTEYSPSQTQPAIKAPDSENFKVQTFMPFSITDGDSHRVFVPLPDSSTRYGLAY